MDEQVNKDKLRVSLIQLDIVWENSEENFENIDQLLEGIETDLIVLPEMFNTGFSMDVEKVAEPPFGKSFLWMEKTAKKFNAAICGSISTFEGSKYYNRFYFVTPHGAIFLYDKKHLFSYGKETEVYSAGNSIATAYYLGWKIRPIVCYDLRFPVWIRNTDDYHLMICVANWPAARTKAWLSLLKARAIENMSYVIGVNRTGTDGYKLEYKGGSNLFDSLGEQLEASSDKASVLNYTIDKTEVMENRKKYHFLDDRDAFYIED